MSEIPRVLFCGAVDDGKSTIMGRLLVETGSVPLDEIEAATIGSQLDFSLLTDGLSAEREQGITIDVCYRHLSLPGNERRILADCPGHEQYTRNMAVAASTANTAVLVIDASRGIRAQSYRHAAICALMGVSQLIVAVNKLDIVADPRDVFDKVIADGQSRIADLGFAKVRWIPTSGLRGDWVGTRSDAFDWYDGPTLVSALVAARPFPTSGPLRFPIQSVLRQDGERWYAGRLASGELEVGQILRTAMGGPVASVTRLLVPEPADRTWGPRSVAIRLDREIDVHRGDVLVAAETDDDAVGLAHLADMVWLGPEPFLANSTYLLRVGPTEVPTRVVRIRYHTDVESGLQFESSGLSANDLARVEIITDRPVLLDPYKGSRDTGGFILVDRTTGSTVAAGLTVETMAIKSEVVPQTFTVERSDRERLNGVRSCVLWLTGIPASGKSTIADATEQLLHKLGVRSYVLDGDAIRTSLNADLGFSPEGRAENVRRVSEVARLMMDSGLVVIVSLVSPFRADRERAKSLFPNSDFFEVFVDTPLEVCELRDPRGLYARAREDSETQMTGIGQEYEPPLDPAVVLDGTADVGQSADALVQVVLARRLG